MLPILRIKDKVLQWLQQPVKRSRLLPGSERYVATDVRIDAEHRHYEGRLFRLMYRIFQPKRRVRVETAERLPADGLQLEAVLAGTLIDHTMHPPQVLSAGQYKVSHPMTLQAAFRPGSTCHYFVVHYAPGLLKELAVDDQFTMTPALSISPAMQQLIEQTTQPVVDASLQRLHYERCIRELLFLHLANRATALPNHLTQADLSSLLSADHFLQQTLAWPGATEDLAKQVGLSLSKLKKGFRVLFQMAVFERLTHHRIVLGKKLLEQTSRTIEDIAYETGYRGRSAFSHAFRKVTGQSPSLWRKQFSPTG